MLGKKRKVLIFAISIVTLLTVIYIFIINRDLEHLDLFFLDVGQGDAAFLRLPGRTTVLIDGGPDNSVIRKLGEILPFYERNIDMLILSHPHDDHLLGLIEVVRRYKIGTLIYMWQDEPPELLNILLEAAERSDVNVIELKDKIIVRQTKACEVKIINPESLGIKEDPNNSLVTKVNCDGVSALFTGDNSSRVEEKLLQTNEDWSAKIFKAAHHGSKTANSEEFLKAVSPSLVVISVGALNRFGHPSAEIIELILSLGIRIKRTDQSGTIGIK